jgi:hypothetical protein
MPAKPLYELAASVERLIGYDRRESLRQLLDESLVDWENARELVRRLREGVAKCDEMELTPGFDQVSTSRRGAARQIRAALTGATEETKRDG